MLNFSQKSRPEMLITSDAYYWGSVLCSSFRNLRPEPRAKPGDRGSHQRRQYLTCRLSRNAWILTGAEGLAYAGPT